MKSPDCHKPASVLISSRDACRAIKESHKTAKRKGRIGEKNQCDTTTHLSERTKFKALTADAAEPMEQPQFSAVLVGIQMVQPLGKTVGWLLTKLRILLS